MAKRPELETRRLKLRRWRAEDLPQFAALNADPVVMKHFPRALTERDSANLMAHFEDAFDRVGYSIWAVEVASTGGFIGFCGLMAVGFEASFTPAVEIGWRLARDHWGNGYATEAARAVLGFAFDTVGLDEVVSFTTVGNTRSRAVMERLGMSHDPGGDFDHPLVDDRTLRHHVLYRMSFEEWRRGGWIRE